MIEINDKSLLKCTVKKSADVLRKVVLYASYVIVAITAIGAVYFGITKIWEPWVNVISVVITAIWAILSAIPWYVYAGVIVILAIPVYSLVWCIARELTEEDWKSDIAQTIAFALLALLAFAFALLAFAFAFALAVALAVAFALALVLAAAHTDNKIFLFPGAYLHYRNRKRIRERVIIE